MGVLVGGLVVRVGGEVRTGAFVGSGWLDESKFRLDYFGLLESKVVY